MLKIIKCALAAIVSVGVEAKERQLPPETGKFFYADFKHGTARGSHLLGGYAGSNRAYQPLLLTTDEYKVGIFTKQCSSRYCDVPNLYDATKSSTVKIFNNGKSHSESVNLYDKNNLLKTTFYGIYYNDSMEFQYRRYDRKTEVNITYLGITRASKKFSSKATGFVGIKPYTANIADKERSFLWNLYDQGVIDHAVVSMYVREEGGNSSVVKFGSYDKQGLMEGMYGGGKLMHTFKTRGLTTWSLETYRYSVGGKYHVFASKAREFSLNPQYSYLYIPDVDFADFRSKVNSIAGKTVCTAQNNYCRFPTKCEYVKSSDYDMTINMGDPDAKLDFKVYGGDLLISGRDLGLDDDNCFLAVFRSKQSQNTWYVGNLFMRKYYVVYDMTPHTERGEKYIQVGIGLQNQKYLVGEEVYDPKHPGDEHSDEESQQDSSADADGKDDFYDQREQAKIDAAAKEEEEEAERKAHGLYLIIGGVSLFLVLAGVVFCCVRAKQAKNKNDYNNRTYSNMTDVNENKTGIN